MTRRTFLMLFPVMLFISRLSCFRRAEAERAGNPSIFEFPLWFEPEPSSARSRRSIFNLWLPFIKSAS